MSNQTFKIICFGKVYSLPKEVAIKHNLMNLNQPILHLNLSSHLQPAFDYIYMRFFTPYSSANGEVLLDAIELADNLGLNLILDDIATKILQGSISEKDLLEDYRIFEALPKIQLAAATFILSQHTYWEDLPSWIQQITQQYITKHLPSSRTAASAVGGAELEPVLIRFVPFDDSTLALTEMIQSIRCKKFPLIIDPRLIPFTLKQGGHINTFMDQKQIRYITCSDGSYPIIKRYSFLEVPCCSRFNKSLNKIPWKILENKKVLNAGNYIVFVHSGFQGNYIYSLNYQVIPELNAILVLQ